MTSSKTLALVILSASAFACGSSTPSPETPEAAEAPTGDAVTAPAADAGAAPAPAE
jgi:hypothetical protein